MSYACLSASASLSMVGSALVSAETYTVIMNVKDLQEALPPEASVNEDNPILEYLEAAFSGSSATENSIKNIVTGQEFSFQTPVILNDDGSFTVTTETEFTLPGMEFNFATDSIFIISDLYFGRHVSQTSQDNIIGYGSNGSYFKIILGSYGNPARLRSTSKWKYILPSYHIRSEFGVPYNSRQSIIVEYDVGTMGSSYYANGSTLATGGPLDPSKTSILSSPKISFGSDEEKFYGSFIFIKRDGAFTDGEKNAIINNYYSSLSNI